MVCAKLAKFASLDHYSAHIQLKTPVLSLLFLLGAATAHSATTDSINTRLLDEAVVTGTRAPSNPALLSQTVDVVTRSDIERSMQPSVLPVITQRVPGLFTTARGVYGYGISGGAAGNIAVRGLSGSSAQVLTLIDGHPQYSGIFGHPISDALQSVTADRVEVVRGPASAIYGSNAMGGVINIISRRMTADGYRATLNAAGGSYGTVESNLTLQGRKGPAEATAGGAFNRSDNNRRDMGFTQRTVFARAACDITDRWRAHAGFNLTNFTASNPGTTSNPLTDADQNITRGAAAVGIDNDYGKTRGAVSLFFNWGHHWINDGYASGAQPRAYRFISDDNMAGASLWQSASLIEGNVLTLGADWFRFSGHAHNKFVSGPSAGTSTRLVDKWHAEYAGYADIRQTLGRLTLSAALRADHLTGSGTRWVPRFGAAASLPHDISVKLSAGEGFRYPTLREMYMFGPANPDLRPESSWTYELAFRQTRLDGDLDYGLNIFFIDADNIILTIPREGATPLNVNSGRLINRGVEAEASWRITPSWRVDANYSYVDMRRPVIAAPTHKLNTSASFTANRFFVSTGLQYIAGLYKSVSPVERTTFTLLDLCAEYRATQWLSLWMRGENLLARSYEINSGFPMPRATFMTGIKIDL